MIVPGERRLLDLGDWGCEHVTVIAIMPGRYRLLIRFDSGAQLIVRPHHLEET